MFSILLLIGIASTSTLSAYSQLRESDVVKFANDVAKGDSVDVQSIADKANQLNNRAVKDFADRVSIKLV